MPPKKKGGGKGGGGNIIDGVDTTSMTREQLEVFCLRIKEENEREREERNFFQMERDKLRTFWEITRNELDEARAKLRNKDRQIEEAAEKKNAEELKYYKQKVKHIQYEHQIDLTESEAEALVSLKNIVFHQIFIGLLSSKSSKARNKYFFSLKSLENDILSAKLPGTEICRNKDRQIEEAAEKNAEELKYYKQKVKHIQYEHQNDLTESKAEALVSLKNAQNEYTEQERELLRDKKALKEAGREQEIAHEDQVKAQKLAHHEEISKARTEFEERAKELELKYEKKFADLKFQLNTKHDMEISEVEERKNNQITELTRHHERAFNEMKNYYNDITLNNLALISSLKDQMEILRKQNERMTKQVADLTAENKKLLVPLKKALDDVSEYKRQLTNYEKDKISLANTKAKLSQTVKDLGDLRWSHDTLELRFNKLQEERDELHKRFVSAILEVQQKTGAKNILLQKRIQTLTQAAELREVVIGELQATATKPVERINRQLEEILSKKNGTISDLQYELARVCKAHDDMLETFQEKLNQYGISREELGFTPMRIIPEGQAGLAKGPAGLITKNR